MGYGKTDVNEVQNDKFKSLFHKVPEAGGYYFFCPPWAEGLKKPYFEIKLHYEIDKTPLLCLACVGLPCPACIANNEVRADSKSQYAQDLSKKIYAKSYYLYSIVTPVEVVPLQGGNVLRYKAANAEDNPKVEVVSFSLTVKKIIDSFYSFYQDIHDPTAGNMVQLSRQPSNNPDVPSKIFPTVHPAKCVLEPRLMELMAKLPDLSKHKTPIEASVMKDLVDAKLAPYRSTRGAPVAVPVTNPIPSTPDLTQAQTIQTSVQSKPMNPDAIASSFVQSGVAPSPAPTTATTPAVPTGQPTPPPGTTPANTLSEFEEWLKSKGKK